MQSYASLAIIGILASSALAVPRYGANFQNYTATVRSNCHLLALELTMLLQFEMDGPDGSIIGPAIPGPYDSLYYDFSQGPFDEESHDCADVCAQSFPATIAFTQGAVGSMTANYNASKVVAFDLYDFYFGCNGNANFTYDGQTYELFTPANCTMTVKGYRSALDPAESSKPDAQISYSYVPQIGRNFETSAPKAVMGHYFLPSSFNGMRTVTFSDVVYDGAYNNQPQVLIDNVSYGVLNYTSQ